MDNNAGTALAEVGRRLRAARSSRDMTLSELSQRTSISVSTLSRLESGQRRATLELLVPVARILGVTLDDLVATTPAVDPRVVCPPINRDGMTIIPLSGTSSGLQAFHHTLPASDARTPDLRTHEGYEWIYILRGRVRLLLGGSDLVLTVGEAAEFDTRIPHWFGNAGRGPAQYLSLFGPQGERVHVRASPRPAGPPHSS
jgi:transcriptional regulator with XRE-family HTH domain